MNENLLHLYKSGYALDANGNEVANSDFNIYQALVNVNTLQYTLSGTAPSDRYIRVHEYVNNTWVRQTIADYGSNLPFSITKSASTNRFLISINKNNSNMALTAYYMYHAAEGEYPINDNALSIVQTTFTPLYPTWLWRIDDSNDGYPYTELLLGVLYVEPTPPPPPEPPGIPIIQTDPMVEITDQSSIEYQRYLNGYTNPNLYRFRDGDLPEDTECEVAIKGTNSYRYTGIPDYEDRSTESEIP